jgi:hypothetical protein
MSNNAYLSGEEFSSLQSVGLKTLTRPRIPAQHSEKLLRLRFIAVVSGHNEATVTGLLRIADGN